MKSIKSFFYGLAIGGYGVTLINDLLTGLNLKGFIFGTISLILFLLFIKLTPLGKRKEGKNED